jgi:hypothetical protein
MVFTNQRVGQAILRLDNADYGWIVQQMGNETARRFQL